MGNVGGWRALTFWSDETRTCGIEGGCAELLRMLQPRKMSERYSALRRRVCIQYWTIEWRMDSCRCSCSSEEWDVGGQQ